MKAIEYLCTVKSFQMLTPTVFEITFETNEPLVFRAGQFVSVIIPGAGPKGRDLRRAYSIASSPESKMIELCVKILEGGSGNQYLHSLRPGDPLRVVAPYGDFIYEPKEGRYPFFIASGTGIAPFRSIVMSKLYQEHGPSQAYCLLGVRSETELLYTELFQNLKHLQFIPAVSQPSENWEGYQGRVTSWLRQLKDDFSWNQFEYYICGNGDMIQEVKAFLLEKGVAKQSIHQEKYY